MKLVRRRLSWLLAGWLVFQLVGITAPVVLSAIGIVEETCTCPGTAEGATCPMHHGASTAKHHANPCAFKNASPPTEIALLAMVGGAGVLPQTLFFDVVDQSFTRVFLDLEKPLSRTDLPDSPPPRS